MAVSFIVRRIIGARHALPCPASGAAHFLLHAVGTYALVIKLHIVHLVAAHIAHRHKVRHVVEDVDYAPATLAIEVGMGGNIPVVADTMLVDGYHLGGIVFGKQAERVVNRGAAECGNLRAQAAEHVVHRRMRKVRKQVLHYGNALHRRLYAMSDQSIVGFVLFHIFQEYVCS